MEIKDIKGMYTINIDTRRNIVYETQSGLWKPEDLDRFHNDYLKKVAPLLRGKTWAKCSDLRNYRTSMIADDIKNHIEWASNNGLKKAAMIVDNSIVKMQMKRSGGGAMDPIMFGSENEADVWLKSQGF